MGLKKLVIICFVILVAGAAISIFLNIKDTLESKTGEILVENTKYKNIDVISDNSSVVFLPTKDSVTKVEYSGKMKSKSKYKFNAEVKKDTLYVELTEKRWGFIQFGFTSMDIELTVHVPEKEYNEIIANIDNGRITVKDIQAKDIQLETDNGLINLKDTISDTVKIRTDNGQIMMDNVEGNIEASTDNGRIVLVTNNLERSISLSTDNGFIEIQTDKEPTNVTIDADLDVGKLNVFGNSSKQTVFGDGKNLIQLETDNGSIKVGK